MNRLKWSPKQLTQVRILLSQCLRQGVLKAASTQGFNVIILAFYLENGPTDVALAWEQAGQAAQQSVMNHVHSKNAVVLVSAGGVQ